MTGTMNANVAPCPITGENRAPRASAGVAGWLLAGQALAVGAVLAVALAHCGPERTGLLIATGGATEAGVHWSLRHGARLLGSGALPGSILIRTPSREIQLDALVAGFVLIPAPDTGCA